MPESNLTGWKKKDAENGNDAFPSNGNLPPEKERIRRLERETEILRQKRDIQE